MFQYPKLYPETHKRFLNSQYCYMPFAEKSPKKEVGCPFRDNPLYYFHLYYRVFSESACNLNTRKSQSYPAPLQF